MNEKEISFHLYLFFVFLLNIILLEIVKFVNYISNLLYCDVGLIRFRIDEEHQNTTIVSKLINNTIAATFALLDIAVFQANFEDNVACS